MNEPRKPPVMSVGLVGWMKSRLFSSPSNTFVTLLILYGFYLTVPAFWQWAVIDATWVGGSSEACDASGACWAFVNTRLNQFTYGFYPADAQWRVDLFFLQLGVVAGWVMLPGLKGKKWVIGYGLLIMPFASWGILYGGFAGLEVIETHLWGGLMLTLLLALCGMIASFPIGVLLALGRRSKLPAIRALSTVYIEVWRGVPLITVLFMASVMLPLFVPENIVFDKLLRALIGIVMFQSAYMAR